MTGVVAYLALVVATAALLCGHQGVTRPRRANQHTPIRPLTKENQPA